MPQLCFASWEKREFDVTSHVWDEPTVRNRCSELTRSKRHGLTPVLIVMLRHDMRGAVSLAEECLPRAVSMRTTRIHVIVCIAM